MSTKVVMFLAFAGSLILMTINDFIFIKLLGISKF